MGFIKGYKGFNTNRTNYKNEVMEAGKTYHMDGEIKFHQNGYHMCKHICDVFRYCNSDNVAEVIGTGAMSEGEDAYYGYFDMFAVENIEIIRFLSRDELITLILSSSEEGIIKALSTFRLNDIEKSLFLREFEGNDKITRAILYYQYGCKDIYEHRLDSNIECKRLVKEYGQNNNKGS